MAQNRQRWRLRVLVHRVSPTVLGERAHFSCSLSLGTWPDLYKKNSGRRGQKKLPKLAPKWPCREKCRKISSKPGENHFFLPNFLPCFQILAGAISGPMLARQSRELFSIFFGPEARKKVCTRSAGSCSFLQCTPDLPPRSVHASSSSPR